MSSGSGLAWYAACAALPLTVGWRVVSGRRKRVALNTCLHELRRPLTTLALERPLAVVPDGRLDSLTLALAALDDLDRRINGERRRGEWPSRRRPVDPRELVAAAVGRWRLRAERTGRVIRVQWGAGNLPVRVDPVRASQALDNLIANAIEHGRGPVVIEGSRGTGRVDIAVRDSGPKVPPRLAVRRRRVDPRRGHGLRLSRELMAREGGKLSLRRGPRQTAALMSLPLAPVGGMRAGSVPPRDSQGPAA